MAESTATATVAAKILKQVNFYFSDANLARDRFLKEKITAEGADRYVELSILMSFNRMKQLSKDVDATVAALATAELLEFSEDNKKIRRKTAFDFDLERPDIQERTVYMKGFPVEATLDKIQDYFNKLAKVEIIRMRQYGPGDKTGFKGSVLVQFVEPAKAEEVSKMELKYGEFELKEICMMNKWKDFKESTSSTSGRSSGKGKKKYESMKSVEKTPGVVLFISNVGEGVAREDIQNAFGGRENLAFVEFRRDQPEGYVRFKTSDDCTNMVGAVKEKKIEFGGKVPELKILKGEEEDAYWTKVITAFNSKKEFKKGGRHNKRRGNFGKGGFGRKKRHRDDADQGNNSRAGKAAKTEE